MAHGAAASSIFKILVATDCHLGYMEKDEVRRNDSFVAFEEICMIAQQREVDFVLLGGDLFHENKPSRTTLVRTIEILRRYCLNDRPVQFQIVSDQMVNFQSKFGHVNYEDPHFNVGMPVFTIHGNHDDPAGVDNLSAIDILSSSNLVNYFGKTVLGGSGVGNIVIHPILLQKGTSKLALYGLGNIRDERLNHMFQTPHAVQWMRPESQENFSVTEWFSIFVLHQNRVKSNPKNAISEQFLPRFLDFVVWGHEHECLVDPQESPGMGFHISQPGSSVATSLIEGEARQKHVLLLDVKGSQYRPTKIPLESVRPFEYEDVVLRNEADLNPLDQSAVLEFLDNKVYKLIERAAAKVPAGREHLAPLVRIRVDYTGYTTVNPQRFGQKFVGKVANPHDILLFSKAAKKRQQAEGRMDEEDRLAPEELNQQNIEALLAESNLSMGILSMTELGLALHEYVNKDDKLAFVNFVNSTLKDAQTKLANADDAVDIQDEHDVEVRVNQFMQRREAEVEARQAAGLAGPTPERPSSASMDASAPTPPAGRGRGRGAAGRGRGRAVGAMSSFGSLLGVEDDDLNDIPLPNRQANQTATRGGSARGLQSTPPAPRGRRGRGAAAAGRASLRQTTLELSLRARPSQRGAAAARTQASDEEEEDAIASDSEGAASPEEDVDEGEDYEEDYATGRGRKRAARGRGPSGGSAKRGRGSGSAAADGTTPGTSYVDDDDEDNNVPLARTGRGRGAAASRTASESPRAGRRWGSSRR